MGEGGGGGSGEFEVEKGHLVKRRRTGSRVNMVGEGEKRERDFGSTCAAASAVATAVGTPACTDCMLRSEKNAGDIQGRMGV